MLLYAHKEPPVFHFMLFKSCSAVGHNRKQPGSIIYIVYIDKIPLSLVWGVALSVLSRGEELAPLDQLATHLKQARILLAFFATRTHCWLVFSLVSARAPGSFSAKLLSNWMGPSIFWCLGLSPSQCPQVQDIALPLVELHEAPANFSSCWCPSGWHHDPLVYQLLHPALWHQWICWGYTLSHHPDH